jgi:type II secretory pathway component GspD/PulD (secretin)
MIKCIVLAIFVALPVLAEVSTSIPVSEGKNEFRVNTADYYTWNTRTEIYAFKHVKASEFSHVLKNCVSAYGKIQINDKLNMIIITEEPNKLKDILALCVKLDTPEMDGFEKIQSEAIPVNYSKASNILPFIRDYLSIEGDAKANDALNFISVTDHPDVITRIKSEIGKFDIPPREIEFKFHIVEVYKNTDREIGTSWGDLFNIVNGSASYTYGENSQNGTTNQTGTGNYSSTSDANQSTSKSTGISGSISFNPHAITDFIKLMVEKKAIKLVADNSLLCVNNASSTFTFHYNGKRIQVTMKPTAINDKTLMLRTQIISNGETLLENSTLTEIGSSNLLLRLAIDESQTINRSVPVLGTVLPFLFSKDVRNKNVSSIDIVCTPVLQLTKK